MQLMAEDPELATKFDKKSVAEQNSLDLAWGHLMSPTFAMLRGCLFDSQSEMMRFRQLMVNGMCLLSGLLLCLEHVTGDECCDYLASIPNLYCSFLSQWFLLQTFLTRN
jgi:hypothetical protein